MRSCFGYRHIQLKGINGYYDIVKRPGLGDYEVNENFWDCCGSHLHEVWAI